MLKSNYCLLARRGGCPARLYHPLTERPLRPSALAGCTPVPCDQTQLHQGCLEIPPDGIMMRHPAPLQSQQLGKLFCIILGPIGNLPRPVFSTQLPQKYDHQQGRQAVTLTMCMAGIPYFLKVRIQTASIMHGSTVADLLPWLECARIHLALLGFDRLLAHQFYRSGPFCLFVKET